MKKLELRIVRQRHHLTMDQLAHKAGISSGVYYQAELGVAVDQDVASQILRALSVLAGRLYTLQDVAITVRQEEASEGPLRPIQLVSPTRLIRGGTTQ